MMGPGFGYALGTLVLGGAVFFAALYFFAPPAVVAGIAWLIAPRFGIEVDFIAWFGWGLAGWVPIAVILAKFAR